MSALTFEQFRALTPGVPGHLRLELFELLCRGERESCWTHLASSCERAIEDELRERPVGACDAERFRRGPRERRSVVA